jgi:hypothetical protein
VDGAGRTPGASAFRIARRGPALGAGAVRSARARPLACLARRSRGAVACAKPGAYRHQPVRCGPNRRLHASLISGSSIDQLRIARRRNSADLIVTPAGFEIESRDIRKTNLDATLAGKSHTGADHRVYGGDGWPSVLQGEGLGMARAPAVGAPNASVRTSALIRV